MTTSHSNYDDLFVGDLLEGIQQALATARRSCINCQHFDEPSEGCAKANGGRPPARIIAKGCPAYLPGPPF